MIKDLNKLKRKSQKEEDKRGKTGVEIISVVRSQRCITVSLNFNLFGNLRNNKGKKQKTRGCVFQKHIRHKCWDFVTYCINKSFSKVKNFHVFVILYTIYFYYVKMLDVDRSIYL